MRSRLGLVLTLTMLGCAHRGPAPATSARSSAEAPPATSARLSDVDAVAAAIATRLGRVQHGLGPASTHGNTVVFASGKLSLVVSKPEAPSKNAHMHVLARLTGAAAGAMDSCIVGLGSTPDQALANAAERYVDVAFPPLAALLEPGAQVDAMPFSGDEPYGVPGYRGFIGPLSATSGVDLAALDQSTLFADLAPLPSDGRVHIAKAVLEAEHGTWWRTVELDAQPTSIVHERWSGATAPAAPAIAIRFAVFGRPDTRGNDDRRAEASRILGGLPAWLREERCPSEIMPATLVEPLWSSQACAGGRLLDCVAECESGRPSSCYGAAIEVQQLKAVAVAQALFLRACRLGNASACTNAAAGRPMDACSVRTWERTCAQTGDPWGCAMLGLALIRGEGVARDLDRARKVLPKACALGKDDPACTAATSLLGQIDVMP